MRKTNHTRRLALVFLSFIRLDMCPVRRLLWARGISRTVSPWPGQVRTFLAHVLTFLAAELLALANTVEKRPSPVRVRPIEQERECAEEWAAFTPPAVAAQTVAPAKVKAPKAKAKAVKTPPKVKVPGKRTLAKMTDAELLQLGRDLGLKGLTKKMRRDTLLWRITTQGK